MKRIIYKLTQWEMDNVTDESIPKVIQTSHDISKLMKTGYHICNDSYNITDVWWCYLFPNKARKILRISEDIYLKITSCRDL